ncbi:uncharacterized protein LOC106464839 [Limulus polyphemus]|uniref:Uncharacterized protein LOC106464839 n=1 Tax=Limulus polyphemus TaxID=6850 RepID=A0ABM1BEN5_LIMPO|nr:uncharacterized protein LOC106464839 [Limulus polyphemus]
MFGCYSNYYKFFLLVAVGSWCCGQPLQAFTNEYFTKDVRYMTIPTPFPIRKVNESEVISIQRGTLANNRTLVTNTTLSDLMNVARMKQKKKRERVRQEWLKRIKSLILHGVGMSREPNVSSSVFSKKVHQRLSNVLKRIDKTHSEENSKFFEKLQSFYPSCSLPESIDRDLWSDPTTFNVYYTVNFRPTTSHSKVKLAKLRFYKNRDLQPEDLKQNLALPPWPLKLFRPPPLSVRNTGLTVSLYRYRRPLTNISREDNKSYLYSRIIAANYRGWINFDVTYFFQIWSKKPDLNYGFKIEVEDSYEGRHNPNLFFVNINCTDEEGLHSTNTTSLQSPFPYIEELNPNMRENDSAVFEDETFPTLDLQTVEVSPELNTFRHPPLTSRSVVGQETKNVPFSPDAHQDCDVSGVQHPLPKPAI